ncbi:MAG: hypothetical protein AAF467_12975 [Actinomycetota bacterium]
MNRIRGVEVFGLPVAGAVLAAMAVFVYQWMWFGSVFKVRWNLLIGLPEDQLVIPQVWWAVAFGFILAQMFGVAHVLKRVGWPSLRSALTEVAAVAALLAAPLAAYPLLYHPDHSWERFAYEAGAFVIGWLLGAVIIWGARRRPVRP